MRPAHRQAIPIRNCAFRSQPVGRAGRWRASRTSDKPILRRGRLPAQPSEARRFGMGGLSATPCLEVRGGARYAHRCPENPGGWPVILPGSRICRGGKLVRPPGGSRATRRAARHLWKWAPSALRCRFAGASRGNAWTYRRCSRSSRIPLRYGEFPRTTALRRPSRWPGSGRGGVRVRPGIAHRCA